MAYISLYRKYRPQSFDEVVGQEHVTTTLKNAIAAGRVGSGYLFTGTRGTAKTTCARILAKAVNCIGADGTLTSITPTPCGVCGPCKAIAASTFVDVLEMDAASHRSIDDVRDLIASIKFPPMEGRYKVYIIDEAHQLSRDAMDAFLKTLEEPPDRVVFVLATTELDKLPITIASRCQVFEFKRGSVAAISSRLEQVLTAEKVSFDQSALTLIARAADGSYRDSLSLMEQVLAYKPDNITPADVSTVLGTVDDDLLSDIIEKISSHDSAGAFTIAETITSSGKDIRQFLRTLAVRYRDMLYVSVGAVKNNAVREIEASALNQAQLFTPQELLSGLEIISETERELRWASQHRLVLEMTLLKLAWNAGEAIAYNKVSPLGAPRPSGETLQRSNAPTTVLNHPTDVSNRSIDAKASSTKASDQLQVPPSDWVRDEKNEGWRKEEIQPVTPPPVVNAEPVAAPSIATSSIPSASDDIPFDDEDDDELDPTLLEDAYEDDEPLTALGVEPEPELSEENLLQVQQVAHVPVAAPLPVNKPSPDAPPVLAKLQRSWQEVLNRLGARSPMGQAMIKEALPVALNDRVITLQVKSQFNVDRLESNERGRKVIEDIINKTLECEPGTYKIKCVLETQTRPAVSQSSRQPVSNDTATPERINQSVAPSRPPQPKPVVKQEESPLVDEVIAVFGGQVIKD